MNKLKPLNEALQDEECVHPEAEHLVRAIKEFAAEATRRDDQQMLVMRALTSAIGTLSTSPLMQAPLAEAAAFECKKILDEMSDLTPSMLSAAATLDMLYGKRSRG